MLVQGPTGGPNDDLANTQCYSPPAYDYSFTEETLEVAIRLRIVESTVTLPGSGQPKSGFTVYLKDSFPRNVFISFGETEVFLGSTNSAVSEIVPYDTTFDFADYLLRVNVDGATLSINGTPVATLPYSSLAAGGAANFLGIGDVFDDQRGSAEIEFFRFSRVGPAEPFARDVTIATETFDSVYYFAADQASGYVACPAGMSALSGGASVLSNTGADDDLRIHGNHPSSPIPGGYAGWFAKIVRYSNVVSSDPFQIEVHALCGEVPDHLIEVEDTSFPAPTPPLECLPGLSQIGGQAYETEERDHISCADALGWIKRTYTTAAGADTLQEVNAECPSTTYLIGGAPASRISVPTIRFSASRTATRRHSSRTSQCSGSPGHGA